MMNLLQIEGELMSKEKNLMNKTSRESIRDMDRRVTRWYLAMASAEEVAEAIEGER